MSQGHEDGRSWIGIPHRVLEQVGEGALELGRIRDHQGQVRVQGESHPLGLVETGAGSLEQLLEGDRIAVRFRFAGVQA